MKQYTAVSLFSGAGGLDLGFAETGRFKIVFANELKPAAAKTYSNNLGLKLSLCSGSGAEPAETGTILACDVSRVDFTSLSGSDIDVVIGGPPCQDFSIVRGPDWDRRGIEVKRGRLYAHFVRALVTLQPKAFVFENVPGLVSANKGMAYKVILEDFANLKIRWDEVRKVIAASSSSRVEGYEIAFNSIVDFSKLGVPQKRERLIIIGVRKDLVRRGMAELLTLWAKLRATVGGRRWLFYKYPLTPIEVFEGQRLDKLDGKYRDVMKKWENVWREVGTPRALKWKEKVWDRLTFNIVEDYLAANKVAASSPEELEEALRHHEEVLGELGYLGQPVEELTLPDSTTDPPREDPAVVERMKRIPPGENHEFVRGTPWEVEGRGISLVYKRIHPLKPAYTVVAYGGGGTRGYHYDRDRVTLTLREKARLQTFPDSFLFYGRKSEIRAQIGEAVPPLAAKRIAEALAAVLDDLA